MHHDRRDSSPSSAHTHVDGHRNKTHAIELPSLHGLLEHRRGAFVHRDVRHGATWFYAVATHACDRTRRFLLSENVLAGVAGMTADANSLVNYARNAAQKYLLSYDDNIPVEQLVQRLCDLKQGYTQFGGLRPFGVSLLYAGFDAHHGFQLYQSDLSGN